jgi:hypothetical protein
LQRFAQLVEQAGVLDGDDGLRGEVREQFDLFIAERADLLGADDRSIQTEFAYLSASRRTASHAG